MLADEAPPAADARSRLRDLEKELYDHRAQRRVDKEAATMADMVRFIKANRDQPDERDRLDEPEDRIRILQFRMVMLQYKAQLAQDGKSHFLRQAAAGSRPTPCDPAACTDDAPRCLQERGGLSLRQRKMCVERLNALSTALKFEAAGQAARFDFAGALERRTAARRLSGLLLRLDPSEGRQFNHDYLDYWCIITEGMDALKSGQFAKAKAAFARALPAARLLPDERCFPNYFRDLKDVRRHPLYVEALDWVSRGRFLDAQREFRAWLDERPEEPYDLRSHTAPLLARLCGLLHAAGRGEATAERWDELEKDLRRAYTGPTIWALWRRAAPLRDAEPQEVGALLEDIARDWRLFNQDTKLTAEDRDGDLGRRLVLPRFLDVAAKVRPGQAWQDILRQTLRHALLLLAEHEALKRNRPDPLDALELPTAQVIDHLVALVGRSSPKAKALRLAAERLGAFEDAVANGAFSEALPAWQAVLDPLAFFPHVVLVEGSYPQGTAPDALWETTLERCWEHAPHHLVLEGPTPLQAGRYYLLDAAWNRDHKARARIRQEEPAHPSQLAGPMDAFAQGLFGGGPFEPKAFHDWVLQFDPNERLIACRLAGLLQVLDRKAMAGLWRRLIEQIPDAKAPGAAFIGLGAHMGKSGPGQVYPFQQALKEVPGAYPSKPASAFPTLDALDPERLPSAVVFLDDFVGSGDQASRTLANLLAKRPWLGKVRLHFGAAAGFAAGAEAVRQACPELASVVLGKELTEADRAFSPQNPAWASASEREAARHFAHEVGEAAAGPDLALGYQGSQAMIAFPHNVPNNTLPLFWATGKPLLRRA